MKAELEQLIALQQIDTRIRRLQADIQAIPERRAEIEKEFDQRASEIRALEMRRDEARDERARLETELAETRASAERAERNLMSSKKTEEYTAAIREADAARKQISKLEEQILEKMQTVEEAEAALVEHEPEVARLRGEMEVRLAEFEQQTRMQSEELEASRVEREQLAQNLPKNMAAMYNRISTRIRDGVAVAEARNGSCTACYMALRPQVMAQIRRGDEIIICDNCNRILYHASAEAAHSAKPETQGSVAPGVATT